MAKATYASIEKFIPLVVKVDLQRQDDVQRQIFAEEFSKKRRRLTDAYGLVILLCAHRWYLGKPLFTILQWVLIPTGIGVLWVLIDLFLMPTMVKDKNAEIAKGILAEQNMLNGRYAGMSQTQPQVITITNTVQSP